MGAGTAVQVEPTAASCGAFVTGVDLAADLDDETVAAIREAWMDHKVLVFPEQDLSDADLQRHARRFGPFGTDPFFESIEGHDHVAAIHRGADETAPIFAEAWHADWTFQAEPPDGTCLYAKVIPPAGGDTLFADQQAALASMPDDLRARIDDLVAVHSARLPYAPDGTYGEGDTEPRAMRILTSEAAYDTQLHPLVQTHPETGERTLYSTLGYIIGIDGMDDADATELLKEVYVHQTAESVQYRHRWQEGMLVMWDNRCVLHMATGGYDGHERLLHRTTIGYNPDVRN